MQLCYIVAILAICVGSCLILQSEDDLTPKDKMIGDIIKYVGYFMLLCAILVLLL
jgi:hypothetical protein